MSVIALAACTSQPTTTPATTTAAPTYKAFADVDPYTDAYFVNLEDSGLVARIGERRLWAAGVAACHLLDEGGTIDAAVAQVDASDDLGADAGSVVASATGHLCTDHQGALKAWVRANRD